MRNGILNKTGNWLQRIVIALLILMAWETQVSSVGLPDAWERAVMLVEYKRESGKPCLPKTKFDSPDEEKSAPQYCPVGSGFIMKICGELLLISNRHVLSAQSALPLVVRMKNKIGESVRLNIADWREHPDSAIDIAAAHLEIPEHMNEDDLSFAFFNEDKDRQAKEPQSFLLKLDDLRVGDDVLLVVCL